VEGDSLIVKGCIVGTPRYMSPILKNELEYYEQYNKSRYFEHDEYKSDLYSLGIIFLEILLQKQGFTRSEIIAITMHPEFALLKAKNININKYIIQAESVLY